MTTLLNWILTPENRSATMAMEAILEDICSSRRERECNPVFVHGPSGTGKTHLVSAVMTVATQRRPDLVAMSVPAGDVERMLRLEEEHPSAARDMKQADLLVLEDLQQLDTEAAASLAAILDARIARHRQTVLTATEGPGQLTSLPARLTSRMAQGLVLGLLPLSPLSRRLFLNKRAEQRKLSIRAELLDWIAAHVGGSARELDGALSRLDLLARTESAPLTVDMVAAAFAEDAEARRPTVERIAQRVSHYFQLEIKQLRARDRSKQVLLPRQLGMYLARELTPLSLKQIGDYFGGRDHTTVLHACRKVEQALEQDVSLSGVVQELQADLM